MDWLLIIAVTLTAGAEPDVAIVGHMVSRDACILAGMGTAEDRRWLAAWHDDLRAATALVEQGDARRAAKAGVAA